MTLTGAAYLAYYDELNVANSAVAPTEVMYGNGEWG